MTTWVPSAPRVRDVRLVQRSGCVAASISPSPPPPLTHAVSELKRMQGERLKVTFNEAGEREQDEGIRIQTSEITAWFNRVKTKIKGLDAYRTPSAEKEELKLFNNAQRAAATRVHDLAEDFKRVQKSYLAQLNKMRESTSVVDWVRTGGAALGEVDVDNGFTDAQLEAVLSWRRCWISLRMWTSAWRRSSASLNPLASWRLCSRSSPSSWWSRG